MKHEHKDDGRVGLNPGLVPRGSNTGILWLFVFGFVLASYLQAYEWYRIKCDDIGTELCTYMLTMEYQKDDDT